MATTRRRYACEFKIEAVRLLDTSGKSASQIKRELGIGKGNLWRSKRKFGSDSGQGTSGPGSRIPEQERIRELERETEVLRQERDILHLPWRAVPGQEAVAIFSHPRS